MITARGIIETIDGGPLTRVQRYWSVDLEEKYGIRLDDPLIIEAPFGVHQLTWRERWNVLCNTRYRLMYRLDFLLFSRFEVRGPDGPFNTYYRFSSAERQAMHLNVEHLRESK